MTPDNPRGRSFEDGIESALQRILVDPDFLFRVERIRQAAARAAYRVSDLELASRLSFFLWSSIPDDELLERGGAGHAATIAAVLEQQVRRMLARPAADVAGRQLRRRSGCSCATCGTSVPDPDLFPEFDENLREAFLRETELFLESQMRDDRSVAELLTRQLHVLNERLARHYGIPDVYGQPLPAGDRRRHRSAADCSGRAAS